MDEVFIPGLSKWTKPNVRKVFLPDPDHVLFELDLKQSDAQVVAWDADDPIMKQMFREGVDLHTENAKMIYGLSGPPSPHQRQMAKHGVHATDFLVTPKTMAKKLDMTIHQATNFQKRWFDIHPWIPAWHRKLELIALKTRTATNAFGYRRIFFDRIQSIMPEIVAFIPQSTTCNVIDKIMNRIAGDPLRGIVGEVPEVQLLLQVHDSIVGQFHKSHWPTIVPRIETCTKIEVPYGEPLCIGTDFSASTISWGAVRKYGWKCFDSENPPAIPSDA